MATAELLNFPGLAEAGPEFHRALVQVAARLGMNPSYMAGAMCLETGCTFNPAIQNPVSGATGLIQLMPMYFKNFGVTESELKGMSAAEQTLRVVEPFFRSIIAARGGRSPVTMADHYLAVFNPAHIGKSPDTVLYQSPQPGYTQNKGLDYNNDGAITVSDIEQFVQTRILSKAAGRPPLVVEGVDIPVTISAGGAGGVAKLVVLGAVAGGAYYVAQRYLKRKRTTT